MVIVPLPYGRLCNRLVLAASFIAFAEEFGECFVHLAFADYCRFFETTRFSPILVFRPSQRSGLPKRGCSVVKIFSSHDAANRCFLLDDPESGFIHLARTKRVVLALGWSFRAHALTQKHHAVIRRFFTPCRHYRTHAEAVVAQARQGVDHLIGVHIRQTDYRNFAGGKYLFSHETYRRVMEESARQLPGRTGFLVCSDAPIPPDRFKGLSVTVGTGHPIEDNEALSACDFIAGPPSTYSHWASYYGNVPLFFIEQAEASPRLSDFTVRTSV